MILNFIGRYFVFMLLGIALNSYGHSIPNWKYWAWTIIIVLAIHLRDYCIERERP